MTLQDTQGLSGAGLTVALVPPPPLVPVFCALSPMTHDMLLSALSEIQGFVGARAETCQRTAKLILIPRRKGRGGEHDFQVKSINTWQQNTTGVYVSKARAPDQGIWDLVSICEGLGYIASPGAGSACVAMKGTGANFISFFSLTFIFAWEIAWR